MNDLYKTLSEFSGVREDYLRLKGLDIIVPIIRKLDQSQKVKYLNALRKIVSVKCLQNKIGTYLVSDFDLIVAEPDEHAQALVTAIKI